MKTNPQTKERSAINYICILKSKLDNYNIYQGKKEKKHFNLNFLDTSQLFKPAKNEFRATNLYPTYSMKANVVQSTNNVSEQLLCTTVLWQMLKIQWQTRQAQSLSSKFKAYQGEFAFKDNLQNKHEVFVLIKQTIYFKT